jgi:RNA polymerase sigma factor (sigma-70 family)
MATIYFMNVNDTDLQLLARYARQHAEDAFTEIVRRHLNLVFSAAFRQVRSPQLAEEVAQSVFIDLAKQASRLAPDTILSAWLYHVTRRTAIDVVRRESRRQHRERIASELSAMNTTATDWTQIEPFLDEAMHVLDDIDRTAVLLRYFENKSFAEVGQSLSTSEDAARKRVSRAIDQLRECFSKQGVTVAAGGLAAVISTNAVQAAPAGLAATISAAAVLAGTTAATTAIATATIAKAVAMTTLQKALITTTVVAAVGSGIYEARQASIERSAAQILQQQLTRERDNAAQQLTALREENERLNRDAAELASLRSEIDRLRRDSEELAALKKNIATDPTGATANSWLDRIKRLKERLNQTPQAKIPELEFVTEDDWLRATMRGDLKSDADYRRALAELRSCVESRFADRIGEAVVKYSSANGGQLPTDTSQLTAYLDPPVDNAILQRYEIVRGDSLPGIPIPAATEWLVTQKNAVDLEYDMRLAFCQGGAGSSGSFELSEALMALAPLINAYVSANNGQLPNDLAPLAQYVTTPDQQAALDKMVQQYKDKKMSPDDLNAYLKMVQRSMTR